VRDPELREKLRPNYHAACKRLIYSWEYYECVQRPGVSVEVGDRAGRAAGVRMKDGTLHELDVLVLATGFHADRFIRPATVVPGAAGALLDEFWATRPTAHLCRDPARLPELLHAQRADRGRSATSR
jgi:cation diffusion facilitator CzcD-associated flavoprotein CzcO